MRSWCKFFLFCIGVVLVVGSGFLVSPALAQTGLDLKTIIQQLLVQITQLQLQVKELTKQSESTQKELAAFRTEIKELQFSRPLRRGDRGEEVRNLQLALKQAGYFTSDFEPTDYFGLETEKRIKAAQKEHLGIELQDVVAGPKTFALLNEELKKANERANPSLSAITTSTTQQVSIPVITPVAQTSVTPAIPAIPAIPSSGSGGGGGPATPATPAVPATSATGMPPTTNTPPASITHSCGVPINVPQDVSSIQTALNSACSGDIVYVGSGTYYENISIPRSGITLKGAPGTTAETVIVNGGEKGHVVFAKGIQNFTIDGFTLRNASQYNNENCLTEMPCSAGIYFVAPPNYDAGTTIMRNLIVKNNVYGIWAQGIRAGSITLEKNVIIDNKDAAVSMSITDSSNAIIVNNTIANNGTYYIYLGGNNQTLRNNIIANNGGYGVFLHPNSQRTILYNDVWGNAKGNYYQFTSPLSPFTPSPGTGELSVDPKFVSASDYHLQAGSPAINAGDPSPQYNDPDGSRNDMGAYPFIGTVAPPQDITPPVITFISPTPNGDASASVLFFWKTDEPADSQVEYGLTASYGSQSGINSSLVTNHYFTLTGLTASATYHYRVKSKDAAGNLAISGDQVFTNAPRDFTPPTITSISVTGITANSAVVNFATDEPTNFKMSYGKTLSSAGYYETIVSDLTSFSTSRNINLINLQANTTYHYWLTAADVADNQATSGEKTFTTLSMGDPSIHISGTSASQVSDASISVKVGDVFTVSGSPQNLQGLSYCGSGPLTSGCFNMAYFFDQTFGNNNSCGNNQSLATGTWVMTCTAKIPGSSFFYIVIYRNSGTYTSNTVNVSIGTTTTLSDYKQLASLLNSISSLLADLKRLIK